MNDPAAQILEEALGRAEQTEVFMESGETRSVSFENNRLKRATAREFRGVGLRVFAGGRIGFASTTDLRDPRRVVEMALQSAQFGEKPRFELPGPGEPPSQVAVADRAVAGVPARQMVQMGREGLELSIAASRDYLFSADISTKVSSRRLLNSNGLDFQYVKTDMAATVQVKEVSDNGLLQVHEFKSWGRPFDSITDITRAALLGMERGRVIAPARDEAMPMIFTPKAVGNLLGPLLLALNGKHVHKGSSVLAGRLGERVLDDRITIRDDATVPHGPSSCPLDTEGVPTRRVALIEGGVLKGYLLDLQTAALLGLQSTGNGYRSYASQPAPESSNTIVEGGADACEDMVAALGRGVIVDQTLGTGQSNTLAGEFSVNVSLGFLTEGGRIQGRLKDCMVAGNVYELLSRVEGIGGERQWVGSQYVPAICVGGIKLAAGR